MQSNLFVYVVLSFLLTPTSFHFGFAQTYNTASLKGQLTVSDSNITNKNISITLYGPYEFLNRYNAQTFKTKPDSTGQFHFSKLLSGTYYLTVYSPGTNCFSTASITDTLILKTGQELQHSFVLGGDSINSPWFPDRGTGKICVHFTDSLTNEPVPDVYIDFYEFLPESATSSINYRIISQYNYRTDSTGSFCTGRLCHGSYGLSYYYYMDGDRKNVGRDSIFVGSDESVMLAKKIITPQSVRPTKTLITGNINFHLGDDPTGELALGVGHVISSYRLQTQWETLQAGCEFNFRPSNFIVGPKVTYNYSRSFLLIGFIVGGSVIYYTDFNSGNLYLHPHLGVSIVTILDLYAGYNIPLSNAAINNFVSDFTFTIALPILNRKRLEY